MFAITNDLADYAILKRS